MIRRSRAGQLHRSIETLLEMQRPRNLEHACNVMMPAKGRPHGQRRADEVAVNEIWLDGIDQIDQCSRQCGNTPRGADREIEIRNVDRYTSGLILLDHRAAGHRDVHVNAEPHQFAHLAQGPAGAHASLHQLQNSHDPS